MSSSEEHSPRPNDLISKIAVIILSIFGFLFCATFVVGIAELIKPAGIQPVEYEREALNCTNPWFFIIPFYKTVFGYSVELPLTFPRPTIPLSHSERATLVEKVHINGRIEEIFAFAYDEEETKREIKVQGSVSHEPKDESDFSMNATVFTSVSYARHEEDVSKEVYNQNFKYQFVCPELEAKFKSAKFYYFHAVAFAFLTTFSVSFVSFLRLVGAV